MGYKVHREFTKNNIKAETEKAYLISDNNHQIWVSKKLCDWIDENTFWVAQNIVYNKLYGKE